jgi:hypothetical protein
LARLATLIVLYIGNRVNPVWIINGNCVATDILTIWRVTGNRWRINNLIVLGQWLPAVIANDLTGNFIKN